MFAPPICTARHAIVVLGQRESRALLAVGCCMSSWDRNCSICAEWRVIQSDSAVVAAVGTTLFLCRTLIVVYVDCCGTSPSLHTATIMLWKFRNMLGSSSFSNSTGSGSGHTAFSFAILRIVSFISIIVDVIRSIVQVWANSLLACLIVCLID